MPAAGLRSPSECEEALAPPRRRLRRPTEHRPGRKAEHGRAALQNGPSAPNIGAAQNTERFPEGLSLTPHPSLPQPLTPGSPSPLPPPYSTAKNIWRKELGPTRSFLFLFLPFLAAGAGQSHRPALHPISQTDTNPTPPTALPRPPRPLTHHRAQPGAAHQATPHFGTDDNNNKRKPLPLPSKFRKDSQPQESRGARWLLLAGPGSLLTQAGTDSHPDPHPGPPLCLRRGLGFCSADEEDSLFWGQMRLPSQTARPRGTEREATRRNRLRVNPQARGCRPGPTDASQLLFLHRKAEAKGREPPSAPLHQFPLVPHTARRDPPLLRPSAGA